MFIRKKINKGGACCVMLMTGERVAGKKHVVSRIIKYFGSEKDPNKLQFLIEKAESYRAHLELTSPKAKTLKLTSDLDLKSCRSYNTGFTDVYGNSFNKIFSKLDLKPCLKDKLCNLVTMRIASPASKLKTTKLALDYDIYLKKVDSIYRLMDKLTDDVINKIKKTVYDNTKRLLANKNESIDVLFYDLTTIYFETSTQDEIRNFGFSKDGKHQHVQIMLAAIVTKEGLPIDYQEFSGNCYEGHTLLPVLDEIKKRYNIDKIVLVADAALMNKINLDALNERGIQYIISARIRGAKKHIKEEIFDEKSYCSVNKTLDEDSLLKEETKAKVIKIDNKNILIAYHSTMRARKDAHDREKDLERIEKYLRSTGKNKLTSCLRKTYVKIKNGAAVEIDFNKLANEKKYDGYFGLQTNIENANPLDILSSYHGLWQVEQTFRIAKTSLEIRPIFHYNQHRIKAHFIICYMALTLVRYIEFNLKNSGCYIPFEQLHLILDRMRRVEIIDSDNTLFELSENPPLELIPIYKALKINWPKKIISKSNCCV
jgi:transposase